MKPNDLRPLASLALLVTAAVSFATGLVLLTRFHMGPGPHGAEVLGLSRLAWLDLHRFSSVAALGALAVHLTLNARALAGRVRSALAAKRVRGNAVELVLYAVFATTAAAGLAAWLVEGSPPLLGAIAPGPTPHARHALVDLHHLSGLVALALTVHHAGHRWDRLVRGLAPRGRVRADGAG